MTEKMKKDKKEQKTSTKKKDGTDELEKEERD